MSSSNSNVHHRLPHGQALNSSHTIPRTSSNHSLPSINVHSRPHTPHAQGCDPYGAPYPPSGDSIFATPSPSFKVTSSARSSPRGRDNISPPALHTSASNSSLRSAPLRPSVSIPSIRNEPLAMSSSQQQWSRTHCPSPSAPSSPSLWTTTSSQRAASPSSIPPSVLVKTKPGSPPPGRLHESSRSTSDTWAPSGLRTSTSLGGIAQTPAPRLQRKKSSASLLVSGIGRGLGRVGSVMRRNNNNKDGSDANAPAQGGGSNGSGPGGPGAGAGGAQTAGQPYNAQTWSGRPRLRRVGSTQLQDLCEDENEARNAQTAPRGMGAAPQSAPSSAARTRDAMPPGWTRVTAPSTQSPPQPPSPALGMHSKATTESGVSRPFNVQHDLHVAADLEGLPSHWINQLKAQGLSEADLLLITAAQRRQRAVTRKAIEHQPIQPVQQPIQPVQVPPPVQPPAAKAPVAKAPVAKAPVAKPSPIAKPPPVVAVPQVEPPTPDRGTFGAKPHSSKHNKLQAMSRRLSRFNNSISDHPSPMPDPPRPATVVIPAEPTTVVISANEPKPVLPPTAAVAPVAAPPTSVAAPVAPMAPVRPTMSRSVSAETSATMATVGSMGGATGIYRKPSIISKLLDDLDSVSAHPSRPQQLVNTNLCPPATRADASDSEAESLRSSRPPSPMSPPRSSHQHQHHHRSPRKPRSRKSSTASHNSLTRQDSRRLSEDLRGFRDLAINDEDGWASSVLAAWDGENSISMTRTRTASPAPAAVLVPSRGMPETVGMSRHHQPAVAAGFGLANTPPSKPQSLHSLRRSPSPEPILPTSAMSPGPRRRSRSFDFDPALRATLYSPPPPPPHPNRKFIPSYHSVHGSFSLSAAPIVEKRRKSIDSFGNHPEDLDVESCGTRSPSGSELDLGTPPLEAEAPSAKAKQAAVVIPAPKDTVPAPLSILPPRHSSLPHDVPLSQSATTTEEDVDDDDESPSSITSADLANFPSPNFPPPRGYPDMARHSPKHFSFPSSATSHSVSSYDTAPTGTHPQSVDSDSDISYRFSSSVPTVSALGLCLSLGEPSTSSHSNSNSTSPSSASHVQTPYTPYSPRHSRGDSNSNQLTATHFGMGNNSSSSLHRSNTKASKMSMNDDMRLTDNRHSTLSRMSSVASSIHSYNIHEATVHRAYTRVLRRVNEAPREGAETPAGEDIGSSVSGDSPREVESAERALAINALEDAAWRVALRERVATN